MQREKEYLSLEEVAETLGVTYQLIYKLVRAGELPASRLGKLYRVSRKDLDVYLEQTKQPATGGGVCGACGKTYESRLSLREKCVDCDEPICVDCWTRKGIHQCRAHTGKGAGGKRS
jgi:excisionase family DNA binding protein